MRRALRIVSGAVVVVVAATGLGVNPAVRPERAVASACHTMFSSSFIADLAHRYPGRRFTAAVHDTRSGCWSHLNRDLPITTASVIKAAIMGTTLLRAQREGRGLTSWERERISPMIRYSFNNPQASDLYFHGGGVAGLDQLDALVGAAHTDHTPRYGATVSTAIDRTKVALALLHTDGVLSAAMRAEAWRYMSDVHPTQRWGITAGVPLGWRVALKNGFFPGTAAARWRVGSSGFVRHESSDHGYAITVMTDGNPNHVSGQALVEEIARRAAAVLTTGPAAPRPVDRSRCVTTSSVETWPGVAARLGLPASTSGWVQTVSGGNAEPLSGQRACAPGIAPEPSAGSMINERYLPVVTDLSCDGHDDVIWYTPGPAGDAYWRGGPGLDFTRAPIDVKGTYLPVAGDFDGDGCGDVLWYGTGSDVDVLWSGGPGGYHSQRLTIGGRGFVLRAGDFDGDGLDDLLLYRPGSGLDLVWYGTATRGVFAGHGVAVSGTYEPLVGDLDGDGRDDIVWYGSGAAPDRRWWSHGPGRGAGSFDSVALTVNGEYRPVVARLGSEAAAADDTTDGILWYGPGHAPDVRWDGEPAGARHPAFGVDGDYLPIAIETNTGHGVGAQVLWYGPGGLRDVRWVAGFGDAVVTRGLVVH